MVESQFTLSLTELSKNDRNHDPKASSHRHPEENDSTHHHHRCKSQEKYKFEHNNFIHPKVIKASHDIPHPSSEHHEHKSHEDHSRTVTIKKRIVSENILLDSFPPSS
jgi:hypothetical protein